MAVRGIGIAGIAAVAMVSLNQQRRSGGESITDAINRFPIKAYRDETKCSSCGKPYVSKSRDDVTCFKCRNVGV